MTGSSSAASMSRPRSALAASSPSATRSQMAMRARARGIKIFGGTLTPFENETFLRGAYTPEGEAKRAAVNEWIRTGGAFDAVIDFDQALRDPEHPRRMLPIYDN